MTEKESKAKKAQSEAAAPKDSLDSLILDRMTGKYQVVDRISLWAKELRRLEEHRHLTQTEILDLAMEQVLAGEVSEDDLEKKLQTAVDEPPSNGASSKKEEKGKK